MAPVLPQIVLTVHQLGPLYPKCLLSSLFSGSSAPRAPVSPLSHRMTMKCPQGSSCVLGPLTRPPRPRCFRVSRGAGRSTNEVAVGRSGDGGNRHRRCAQSPPSLCGCSLSHPSQHPRSATPLPITLASQMRKRRRGSAWVTVRARAMEGRQAVPPGRPTEPPQGWRWSGPDAAECPPTPPGPP